MLRCSFFLTTLATAVTFEETVVHVFGSNETIRYLSVLQYSRSSGKVWVIGKRSWRKREYLVSWQNCDASLGCLSSDKSQALTRYQDKLESNVAHNAAPFEWGTGLSFVGGRDDPFRRGRRGVYLWSPASRPVLAFRGTHDGCEEKRTQFEYCEFDGRFSIAKRRNTYFLYARANLAGGTDRRGHFGGRHVQTATFTIERQKLTLSPFRRVRILDYPYLNVGNLDNIYFAAVKSNPAEKRTFLGLFPVTSPSFRRSAIAMAVSCDGTTFARLDMLRPSTDTADGRTRDHPVDGFFLIEEMQSRQKGGDDGVSKVLEHTAHSHENGDKEAARVAFFVQANVPGIDLSDRVDDSSSNQRTVPPSSIVRIDVPLEYIKNLTTAALHQLRVDHYRSAPSVGGGGKEDAPSFPCDHLL